MKNKIAMFLLLSMLLVIALPLTAFADGVLTVTDAKAGKALTVTATGFPTGAKLGIYPVNAQGVGVYAYGAILEDDVTAFASGKDMKTATTKASNAKLSMMLMDTSYGGVATGLLNLPIGQYDILVVASGKTATSTDGILASKRVNVLSITEAPTTFLFNLKDKTTGLAGATVTVGFSSESDVTECRLFWGDENGKLTDYTLLGRFSVTGCVGTYTVPDATVIPDGADRVLAYGVNASGLVSSTYATATLPTDRNKLDTGNLLMECQIVSDVHLTNNTSGIYDRHASQMFADIATVSPKSMGLFVAGDIANSGSEKELKEFYTLLNKNNPTLKSYLAMGNHDTLDSKGSYNNDVFKSKTLPTFMSYATNNTALAETLDKTVSYYDYWVGKYHFIMMGRDRSCSNAVISDTQMTWLKKVLDEGKGKACATFILQHNSLYDTICGSFPGQTWNGLIAGDSAWTAYQASQRAQSRSIDERNVTTTYETAFIELLQNYDDVMLFNGHSHWVFESSLNMYPADETYPNIFNTSSVGYLWTDYYKSAGQSVTGSQGYYLYVYKDCVLVRGRDFDTGLWSGSANYCVSLTGTGDAPTSQILPDHIKAEETNANTEALTEPTAEKVGGCAGFISQAVVLLCVFVGLPILKRKRK